MFNYEEAVKSYKDAVAKFVDVAAIEAATKKLANVEAIQENLDKLYDVEAVKANLNKFYDVEAAQEYFAKLYNVEAVKASFAKLLDNEAVNAVKEAFEKAVDQAALTEAVGKNVKLASDLVTTNTNVVADAVIMQSVQVREGVEKALKQVDTLRNSKDLNAAIEAQKAFGKETQESLRELTLANVGVVTNAVEANVTLVKEAFAKPVAKKAPAKKPAAKKAPAKPAAKAAA